LDPVPLSKIGTHLLASLGIKGKNRDSLACLGNAGSHSVESYCSKASLSVYMQQAYTGNKWITVVKTVKKN